MGVSIERSPAAPNPDTNAERSAEIARQGQVGNRRVSTSGGGSVSPIRESVNNATAATPISERSVGLVPDDPTRLPISWFTERLLLPGERLLLLGKKLEGMNQDSFPPCLDLKNVVRFAEEIDKDILRASELLDKSKDKPLNEQEQREVNTLLGAGKYNLEQVQRWTSKTRSVASTSNSARFDSALGKLQERLADRHMDVADLMCLYDLDQTSPEHAVSRADRIDHSLVITDAALDVARGLDVSGLSEDAKKQMVEVLEDHRDGLGKVKDIAIGGDGHNAEVLSKKVWDTSFNLTKGKETGDSIVSLHTHLDAKATGATGDWLPLDHPKLTQDQMLQEFVSHQLKRAGVAKEKMPDLKFKFKKAINQVRNERPWVPIERQLHYTVAGEEHTVHSKITPAKAMAGADHFAADFSANGVCGGDRMQYTHVPSLARTELTDESGQTLFSALRHGVLDAYDISASTLRKLPEQELSHMVKDLLLPEHFIELRSTPNGESLAEGWVKLTVEEIRTLPTRATQYASDMRAVASQNMAEELAVAALVSDPDKLQAALKGETVNLALSSISLLPSDRTANERKMLGRQTAALKQLDSKNLSLQVRDDTGESRTVKVNCKVRTFNFGINAGAVGRAKHIPSQVHGWDKLMGWNYTMERNNPALLTLLGHPKSEALGGNVQDKLYVLEREQLRLDSRLRGMKKSRQQHSWAAERLDKNILECEGYIAATTRSITTLKEAATATKQLWREGSHTEDPYKLVSRLNMVISEMGETLVFNCKSGKDRSGQLDTELKYFTALNAAEGHLPDPDAPMTPELRQMRSDFSLNSGNIEMQRMNIGLPGFEQDSNEVPEIANAIAGSERHSKPSELKISDQITYLDEVDNTCPEQCAIFAANYFNLECKFEGWKHDGQINIFTPLMLHMQEGDGQPTFIDGKTEGPCLNYLLKLDKSAIYLMRTGRIDEAGHNQMLYSKDNEWFVYDHETSQHQVTSNGSLTAAGRDRMVKEYGTWGPAKGQTAIQTIRVRERGASALIGFIKDCRLEGDSMEAGEDAALLKLFA